MNLFSTIERMFAEGVNPDEQSDHLWEKFGRNYAVLVMDSSGFTRTTKQYGILAFLSRLVRVRQVALPVLERCQAVSFKFEADNVYGYFDQPWQAIEAAVGIRQAIADANICLPGGEPFKVCSGVGYGRVLYSETLEGCFGNEMNLASKLGEDVAEPDEILLTQGCYDALTEPQQRDFAPLNIEISHTDISYYTQIAHAAA